MLRNRSSATHPCRATRAQCEPTHAHARSRGRGGRMRREEKGGEQMPGTTTTPCGSLPAPGEKKRPPGPRSLPPLGSAPAFARDIEHFTFKLWQHYGDFVRVRFLLW